MRDEAVGTSNDAVEDVTGHGSHWRGVLGRIEAWLADGEV